MKLHEAIAKARWNNMLRQKVVAKKLGICESYYNCIENGKRNVTLENFIKICKLFPKEKEMLFKAAGLKHDDH